MISFKLCPSTHLVSGSALRNVTNETAPIQTAAHFQPHRQPLISRQSSVADLNITGLCKTIVSENGLCRDYELVHKWQQLVCPLTTSIEAVLQAGQTLTTSTVAVLNTVTTSCRQTIKFAEFGARRRLSAKYLELIFQPNILRV